jgi:hypothetical protein
LPAQVIVVVLSRPGTEVLAVQILRFPDRTKGRATVYGCTVCGFADRTEARAARHGWRVCGFADDGLWGRLSALGIIMIFFSTAHVLLATLVGARLRAVEA